MTSPLPPRAGGILLHPTSLPSSFGIGDLGPAAVAWIDWLSAAGCRLWQVLPLGPTGYGDSPYQSFSAFAGNPLLISPEGLVEWGLLTREELAPLRELPSTHVDYGWVQVEKLRLLGLAAQRFQGATGAPYRKRYEAFRERCADWLDDFALFMALKARNAGAPWTEWEPDLARRDPASLRAAQADAAEAIEAERLYQFLFYEQWSTTRDHAHSKGVTLLGDVPIFVAHDSADVWARPELFRLGEDGRPVAVAGVPPDYFSADGQLWGNPLYDWDRMASQDYAWWTRRFETVLELVDLVRLDHFRGFQAYWEVPAGADTAREGRWVEGPSAAFFERIRESLDGLPILAEDLGLISEEVHRLRDELGLPGMKVLQFAFDGDPNHEYLPHSYPRHCAVYTGTHDNDTSTGWYERAEESQRAFCRRYLSSDGRWIAWDLLRAAWSSVAELAVAPLQDILALGSEARMNVPGRAQGNWTWRVGAAQLTETLAESMRELNYLYGRL